MSSERRAIYAGSFDPPTNGHEYVIKEGSSLFDYLEVTVGVNPAKKPLFDIEERTEMLTNIVAPLGNVAVSTLPRGFLVDYARRNGFTHILKGLRDATDYSYERQQDIFNRGRTPEISTVYVSCPPDLQIVSSSLVKSCIGLEGWEESVSGFVHPSVMAALEAKQK